MFNPPGSYTVFVVLSLSQDINDVDDRVIHVKF